MAAYLVENPPVRSQFRIPRRADPSGVAVVHTAESTPDFVAFDGGAEAVARFIQGRSDPGSYHDLCDSDSAIQLVPYDAEAFHDGTGSNPHSYSVSAATRAAVWPLAPAHWVDGCIYQMAAAAARYATWLRTRSGIVIPARRITRSESELRMPGFISHAERDPARRTDPGAQFPWDQFLAEFARLTSIAPQEVPLSAEEVAAIKAHIDATIRPFLVMLPDDPAGAVFVDNRDGTLRWVDSQEMMRAVRLDGVQHAGTRPDGVTPTPFTNRQEAYLRSLHIVGPVPPGW